jgi:hypothetical protein
MGKRRATHRGAHIHWCVAAARPEAAAKRPVRSGKLPPSDSFPAATAIASPDAILHAVHSF